MGETNLRIIGIVRNYMIDTLKLESPPVCEAVIWAVERHLVERNGFDNKTGQELYNFVSGSLPGSFSSSVAVNVKRSRWVSHKAHAMAKPMLHPVECEPYLTFEGSVHKAMLGHNCFGGPSSIVGSTSWFVGDLATRLGVEFPHWSEWRIAGIDWAEVYQLRDYVSVSQYLHGLGISRYPRRKVLRFGDETVMFPGTTSTVKFYHKGPEFSKNSLSKFAEVTNEVYACSLLEKPNMLLRV